VITGIADPAIFDQSRGESVADMQEKSPNFLHWRPGDHTRLAGKIRFIETSEAKIWKDGTCPTGLAVFGTLVLGAHAYGVTELEGGGLEHIVKQLGYGDDPLNQRASVGWKGMRAAERLVEQYMVRIESASSYSATAAAN